MKPIYLDYNATTPLAPDVADAMSRALRELFGNPSSIHQAGQRAKHALDEARDEVARLVGGAAAEIVFTSGGTESDNLALRGAAEALEHKGQRTIVATAIEHDAVLATCKALGRRGWRVALVPPGADGRVEPDEVRRALASEPAILSVMHANNETGVVQPVAELAAIARERGALVHTDAVQTAGKLALQARALGADLLSISAHKFGGPKGAGALWIRRGTSLGPLVTGGRQERSRRAGTENVPAIVGFGVAARLAREHLADWARSVAALRDRLEAGVLTTVPGTAVNGDGAPRVPNTTNIAFAQVDAEALVIALDLEGIAVSTGAACSSGTLEPSHVLRAMGLSPSRVQSAVRFSLGPATTAGEVDRVLDVLPRVVARLRRTARGAGRP